MADISSLSREFLAGAALSRDLNRSLAVLRKYALGSPTSRTSESELRQHMERLRQILLDVEASLAPEGAAEVRARVEDQVPGGVAVHLRSNHPASVDRLRGRLRHVANLIEEEPVVLEPEDVETLDELADAVDEERTRVFSQMIRR